MAATRVQRGTVADDRTLHSSSMGHLAQMIGSHVLPCGRYLVVKAAWGAVVRPSTLRVATALAPPPICGELLTVNSIRTRAFHVRALPAILPTYVRRAVDGSFSDTIWYQ